MNMLVTGLSFKGVTREDAAFRLVFPTRTRNWSTGPGVLLSVSLVTHRITDKGFG